MKPACKKAKVRAVEARLAEDPKLSQNKACNLERISPATFSRWQSRLTAAGGDPFVAFENANKGGRPKAIEFTEDEIAIARGHRLQKESLEWALYFFREDARVRPETVARLDEIEEAALEANKATNWPESVRKAFRVSENEFAAFRSKKASVDVEMMTARGLFWRDAEGEMHDLLPGELWEMDDYSTNQPFTYREPITGELELGRQVLAAREITGQAWLGFDMIGRPRDAYRGEDIVRFIGRCFRAHGVPRFLRLERGSWESSFVHGLPHSATGQAIKGKAAEGEKVFYWGALDALCHIEHVFKSKGKGSIEGGFNVLQRVLSHKGIDVGRYAGEFEAAAKAWRQARQNLATHDPTELGFLTQGESASAHEEAANLINAKPMQRRALDRRISADDLRNELGWHTNALPDAEAWRLLPYKERRVISGGMVKVSPAHGWPKMVYVVNGLESLCLETGHAVFIAYDPADPARAYVANADASARNREGWAVGQFLCWAEVYESAPQIDLGGEKHSSINYRRQASAAASTEFRAISGNLKKGQVERTATTGTRSMVAGDLEKPETAATEAEARAERTRREEEEAIARSTPSARGANRGGLASAEELERLRQEEEDALNNY